MTGWSVAFAPLFPVWVIGLVALAAGVLVLLGIVRAVRGRFLRLGAFAALVLALMNPSLLQEDREPLSTVVSLVVDQSDSQKLDGRADQTEAARTALKALFEKLPQFELREVVAQNGGADTADATTALFTALRSSLRDVPPNRVGGAILLTDGQVHDIPKDAASLGFNAPIHTLITGKASDRDRRVVIKRAPRFGIVGKNQEIVYRVEDTNIDSRGQLVEVQFLIDGELTAVEQVAPGQDFSFFFDVPHGGKNVVELRAARVDGEITTVNNQAFTVIDGIRENLRVLLVSGEPHAGERTWRNLLKSDASVDLVHFTILRPPEKQDGTPIQQLSLIAFPTRELFIEKIDEFDLIIFDRYQRRGVLPILYFDNIARYLTEGGAILVAAGPEHAGVASIHTTPLSSVLPAVPTGTVAEGPFRPNVTDEGRKHPVTRDLTGLPALGSDAQPEWSRWFRLIETINPDGNVVMSGGDDKPLLVLNRLGEGRIALLNSDHVWLWARGFEGGGPHTQLLRRLGHWLMKEPELDEEALRAEASANRITIRRQTMGDDPGDATMITPTGDTVRVPLVDQGNGTFVGTYTGDTLGLYRIANGTLTALTHVGPANPKEYADVVSTQELLAPLVTATGGLNARLVQESLVRGDQVAVPRVVPVRGTGARSGNGWMGIQTTEASVLKGITQVPLLAGFLGLGILLLVLAGTWAREGR
ncbi:MAG: hypothetical protein AAFO73_04250 [Pseudomonadota bacterium]